MLERLYIKELQVLLQYKDIRSIKRWCRNNGVRILSDYGTYKQFVLKNEFENIYNNCQSTLPNKKIKDINKDYLPLGEKESEFLSMLLNT
jgi:hypothetical protein